MFKVFRLVRHGKLLTQVSKQAVSRRTFLSDSFKCHDSWSNRLAHPILQKVKLDELYYEIDQSFNRKGKASPIDIDIFANAVTDSSYLDEMQDVVHRLRLCSEAGNMLPSTSHALIRAYLQHEQSEELLRILNDRLNYGVFPDDYSNILLMSEFLKQKNYVAAAKVATINMLQEDFSNEIINYMSLYSCANYLLNPSEWEKQEVKETTEEDEEEVKVRVRYLRNPFFDDHFDLTKPDHLIGKTYILTGKALNDSLGHSYSLVGYALYDKLHDACKHAKFLLDNNISVHKDCLEQFNEIISQKKHVSESKNENEENKTPTDLERKISEIADLVEKLKSKTMDEKSLEETKKRLEEAISKLEERIIQKQCQTYNSWETNRESLLKKELEARSRVERMKKVEEIKQQLTSKEEELFFFDRENEFDLKIENKRVQYPKKWLGKKKKKKAIMEEYIPPEVDRSRN